MADKGAKKKAKSKHGKAAAQPSVLGSLPGQRPERIGGRRRTRPATRPDAPETGAPQQAAAKTAAASRPAATKPAARRRGPTAADARRPTAVSPAAPRLETRPRPAPPPPREPVSPPRGTKLVTTAIQAAGELAQIGLTVGGKAVKRAVDRLPKP